MYTHTYTQVPLLGVMLAPFNSSENENYSKTFLLGTFISQRDSHEG